MCHVGDFSRRFSEENERSGGGAAVQGQRCLQGSKEIGPGIIRPVNFYRVKILDMESYYIFRSTRNIYDSWSKPSKLRFDIFFQPSKKIDFRKVKSF